MAETVNQLYYRRKDKSEWDWDEVPVPKNGLWIGRGSKSEGKLILEGKTISRKHAQLELDAENLKITDLGSRHGTFVDREDKDGLLEPKKSRSIAPDTRFYIGDYIFYFPVKARTPSLSDTLGDESFPSMLKLISDHPEGVSRYQALLPLIFQPSQANNASDFLRRYLLLFEAIWEPLEWRQDHIELYFDSFACPESFINWLASWFGLAINPDWPTSRRQIPSEIAHYAKRGTKEGMKQMIKRYFPDLDVEIFNGEEPPEGMKQMIKRYFPDLDVKVINGKEPFWFFVSYKHPDNKLHSSLEYLIDTYKPAYAHYKLVNENESKDVSPS